MTESQWLKAADGDAMLAVVQDRLSPRKWTLLACGVAHRLGELLPPGLFVDAIRWAEDTAGRLVPDSVRSTWDRRLLDESFTVIAEMEGRQRDIVRACDPDADDRQYQDESERRVNPAVPLYQEASRAAAHSIEAAGRTAQVATDAVRLLVREPGPVLADLRRRTVDAQEGAATAGLRAALALELFAKANDVADKGQVKNPRLERSRAMETIHRLQEHADTRYVALSGQKSRADRKALGKLLLEQLGNLFRPYRFNPRWRTEAVVGIARAIDEDRAVERYPILLDALLDADCDEEDILRHVRGTEPHHPHPTHAVGCWVLDLILQKDEPLYARPPLKSTKSGSGPGMQLGLAEGPLV